MDANNLPEMEDEGMEMGFDIPIISSAVTEKYAYFSLIKIWGDIRRRIGTDYFKSGATMVPPFSEQTLIAFIRPGKELHPEPLRENALTLAELTEMMKNYLNFLDSMQSLTANRG